MSDKYTVDQLFWKWPTPGQIIILSRTDKSWLNTNRQYVITDVHEDEGNIEVVPRVANPEVQSGFKKLTISPFEGDKFKNYNSYPMDKSCLCDNCYVRITTSSGFSCVGYCQKFLRGSCIVSLGEANHIGNILKVDYKTNTNLHVTSDCDIVPIEKHEYLSDKDKFLDLRVSCEQCDRYDAFSGTVIAWTYSDERKLSFFVLKNETSDEVVRVYPQRKKEKVVINSAKRRKVDPEKALNNHKFDPYGDYNRFISGKKSKYNYPEYQKTFEFTVGEELDITGKTGEYIYKNHTWDVPSNEEIIRTYANSLFETFLTINNLEYNAETQSNPDFKSIYNLFQKQVEDEYITKDELISWCEEYAY